MKLAEFSNNDIFRLSTDYPLYKIYFEEYRKELKRTKSTNAVKAEDQRENYSEEDCLLTKTS